MPISQFIKDAMDRLDLSQQAIADKIGVSRVTVTKWENGQTEPRGENAVKLAELFGVTPAQLLGYDPTELPAGAMRIGSSPEATVPMLELGSIHAGDPIEAVEDAVVVDVPAGVARRHSDGFLLRVRGDCMNRVYPDGCHVLVDRSMEMRSGCAVAAMIDGGEVVMRRYYRGADTLMLVADSLTGDYDDLVFKGDMADVRLLGVICWFQAESDER